MGISVRTKVIVVSDSEEYQDHVGEKGVVVEISQYPGDMKPAIKVLLDNETVLPDLYETDLKIVS